MWSIKVGTILLTTTALIHGIPHNDPPHHLSSTDNQALPYPTDTDEDVVFNQGIMVKNSCPFPIYLRKVLDPSSATYLSKSAIDKAIVQPDGFWTSPLHHTPDGGVSVKLSKQEFSLPPEIPITQVEYRFEPSPDGGGRQLWYDMSNVDCYRSRVNDAGDEDGNSEECPFFWDGFHMWSWAGCRDTLCKVGEPHCGDVYELPYDDHATLHCGIEPARLWFEVCPGE